MSTLFERGAEFLGRALPAAKKTESLTLKRRTAGDTYPTSDTVTASRHVLDKRDARVGAGLVAAGTLVFVIEAATVASPPRPRDKLIDGDGVEMFINFAQLIAFDKFWRVEVTRAV